jgi:hypothetical protein
MRIGKESETGKRGIGKEKREQNKRERRINRKGSGLGSMRSELAFFLACCFYMIAAIWLQKNMQIQFGSSCQTIFYCYGFSQLLQRIGYSPVKKRSKINLAQAADLHFTICDFLQSLPFNCVFQ